MGPRIRHVALLLAGLAVLAAPAGTADGELIRYRARDGKIGYTDHRSKLPPGAVVLSERPSSADESPPAARGEQPGFCQAMNQLSPDQRVQAFVEGLEQGVDDPRLRACAIDKVQVIVSDVLQACRSSVASGRETAEEARLRVLKAAALHCVRLKEQGRY